MSLDKIKKIDWQLISRKGVNFENLWLSLAAYGFIDCNKQKKKIFGPTYPSAYRQIDGHRDMPTSDITEFLSQAKKIEKQKPGSILKTYYDYQKILNQTKEYADRISDINFVKFSNQQLVDFFDAYCHKVGKTIWYGYNYYFYEYLGQDLYEILKKLEKNINRQAKLFEIFSQARKLSVIQQEKKELLQLIKKIKAEKLSISSEAVACLIKRHLNKFSFMGFFYFRGRHWNFSEVKKRIIEKSKGDLQSELEKINNFEKENAEWQKLTARLKLNHQEIILIKTLKEMAYCTNLYDEVSNYLCAKSQDLLKEVVRRLKISYLVLIEMDFLEIISGLKYGLDQKFRNKLNERLKDSALILANNQVSIISGQELKRYRRLFIKQDKANYNLREFKGQSASVGFARGRVVLVYSVNDLNKVKRGNIMAAKATVPSFVPAMERAAGIITESGGLLSHSAIVSRELNIPCIVGIDKLMLRIKDGDLVEVDATRGIVKKI